MSEPRPEPGPLAEGDWVAETDKADVGLILAVSPDQGLALVRWPDGRDWSRLDELRKIPGEYEPCDCGGWKLPGRPQCKECEPAP